MSNRQTLLVPRARPGRAIDVGRRDTLIAGQRRPARRRIARRSLRLAGRLLAGGLGLAAAAVVAVSAAYALQRAAFLAVTRVEVIGARRLSEPAVLAAAAIEPGANILALDPEAVQDRVEALPGVRQARVVRHLPNRVAILVEEREPYALVNAPGAPGLFWIDADGYRLGPEPRPAVPLLPVLSGVEMPEAGPDRPLTDRLQAGLGLLRALQRAGSRVAGRISEVDLTAPDGPVLYTVDGIEVRIGHEAWSERLARLDGVLAELDERGQHVGSVDLRFRDLVVLRPVPELPARTGAGAGGSGRTTKTTVNLVERH